MNLVGDSINTPVASSAARKYPSAEQKIECNALQIFFSFSFLPLFLCYLSAKEESRSCYIIISVYI
jgi:hypothetical protein